MHSSHIILFFIYFYRQEMDDILNLRTELRREIDLNKRNIMDKFHKIKQGKIDPDVLAEFGLGDKAT